VIAFSVGEAELSAMNEFEVQKALKGHYAAWNYFQSVNTPINKRFVERWRAYTGDPSAVTTDPMEAHFIGFHMWIKAVEKAGTTQVDPVRKQMHGMRMQNLTGGMAEMLPNHHLTKPVLIGQIKMGGQFDIVSQTDLVKGDAWTDHLPMSAQLVSDWVDLKCGKYSLTSRRCVQFR
jgi:urea transport system substrate-binding protein